MQNNSTIRYLKIFRGLITIGKYVMLIEIILIIISSISNPSQLEIPIHYEISNIGSIQLDNGEKNDVLLANGDGFLKYESSKNIPFTSLSALNIFIKISFAIGSFYIYFLLLKIVKSTIDKRPFSTENANRMKWIGYILILTGFLSGSFDMIALFHLNDSFESSIIEQNFSSYNIGRTIGQTLFNKGILSGLFALLVAQILNYGIELKEETALTI
jgi:hypothetical protein